MFFFRFALFSNGLTCCHLPKSICRRLERSHPRRQQQRVNGPSRLRTPSLDTKSELSEGSCSPSSGGVIKEWISRTYSSLMPQSSTARSCWAPIEECRGHQSETQPCIHPIGLPLVPAKRLSRLLLFGQAVSGSTQKARPPSSQLASFQALPGTHTWRSGTPSDYN